MFCNQEQFILALIPENNSLANQRRDSLSKDINYSKESLAFSQNNYDDKFKNMDNKVEKLEQKINLMKEEPYVIHTTILGN